MSLSLRGRFWRAVLRKMLKEQRQSIPEHRLSGKKNAGMLGKPPKDVRIEPVEIESIHAEWISPLGGDRNKVILYLHGGGYVTGAVETYRMLCSLLAESAGARALIPEYRLAPENPYPAALEDALTVYRWLLSNGYKPANIIIAGDSAGGGLSVACALALRDNLEALPAGVICLSPWVDLTLKGQTHVTKSEAEVLLHTDVLQEWALAYTSTANLNNPLVSPVYADFAGFPPLLIQVGSEEILLDDAILLAEKARAAGVKVELKIWQGLWHVWQVLGNLLPENRQTFAEIGQFARAQFPKS